MAVLYLEPTDISYLEFTSAWSEAHSLPTFPTTNNGWLYLAYAVRLYRPPVHWLRPRVEALRDKTNIGMKRIDSDIKLSHDEVLGQAYLKWYLGESMIWPLLNILEATGGTIKPGDSISDNFYRIPEIAPCVRAALGERPPTPYEQLAYGLQLLPLAFAKRGEWSGALRAWLSVPIMSQYTPTVSQYAIAHIFIFMFGLLMRIRGYRLDTAMAEYFSQIPEMATTVKYQKRSWLDP